MFSAGKWGCHGMVRALYCCVLPPEDIRDLEEKAAKTLLHLGKIPVGWEEALFITGVVSSCVSFKPQYVDVTVSNTCEILHVTALTCVTLHKSATFVNGSMACVR